MPMLILLGAAGGALRGLLDVYSRFLDWQADRRANRQLPTGQESEAPRFQEYFDPVADPIAAVVHSAMGAGAAVLLGTTGQVSGAYAAVVVGISAPVILTQLGRVQSVGDAVGGAAPQEATPAEEATAAGSPRAAPPPERPPPDGSGSRPPVTEPSPAPHPTPLSSPVPGPSRSVDEHRRTSFTGPDSPALDFTTDHGAPRPPHGPALGEEGTTG
ncbi:hypothetical protein [Streptomyces tendae]|uniref:hypothetical protein n=1 Tax=Streptomyces tendae TaxID=1932 RepID=UPI0019153591|nr:hypothetical protein [Streptomyces tendae]